MERTVYSTKDGNFVNVTVKGGRIEYFVPGIGWKKSKKFTSIGTVDFTKDWYEVTNIYRKFGIHVASWSCYLHSVYGTNETYPVTYNSWRTKLEQNGFSEQTIRTCFKLINPDYMLGMFGLSSVDVIRLDKDIQTPNGTSTKDHVINVYGNDVGLAIECLLNN